MNPNDLTPPVRADEVTGTLSTRVPPRVFILNALQLVGIAALALNHPDLAPLLAMLPAAIGAKVAATGLALVAAKPAVNLIADIVDNGKLDDSYKNGQGGKIQIIIAFLCLSCFLTSCTVDSDNCYLVHRKAGSLDYAFGPCADATGKIDRYRTEWKNAAGMHLRATFTVATKATLVEYEIDPGRWLVWTPSNLVVRLDGFPSTAYPFGSK